MPKLAVYKFALYISFLDLLDLVGLFEIVDEKVEDKINNDYCVHIKISLYNNDQFIYPRQGIPNLFL